MSLTMPSAATAQSLVEHALSVSIADDCVVIVRDHTSANLRWANNTLTTNGVMHGLSVTVISFLRSGEGVATGSVSGSATTQGQVDELVRAADAAARAGSPAEDANDLVRDATSPDWDEPRCRPISTSTTGSLPRSVRRSAAPPPPAGCSTASSTTR